MNHAFLASLSAWINNPTVMWICIILIAALCILLIAKEMIRTVEPPQFRTWMRTLNWAIVPLVVIFGVIILLRFLSLLSSG